MGSSPSRAALETVIGARDPGIADALPLATTSEVGELIRTVLALLLVPQNQYSSQVLSCLVRPRVFMLRASLRVRPPLQASRRFIGNHPPRSSPSSIYFDPASATDPAVTTTPEDLPEHQKRALDSALRVDQAGELAANYIYMGQKAVLGRDPVTGPLIQVETLVPATSDVVTFAVR